MKNLIQKKFIGSIYYPGGLPFTHELFTYSYGKMIEYNCKKFGDKIHYGVVRSSSHSYARNIMSQASLGDWVIMFDTDAQFEPDVAVRMIECMEKYKLHVLSGVYLYKKSPHFPVLYTHNEDNKAYQTLGYWKGNKKDLEIFRIAAAGGGCLLVRKWAFQYIEQQLNEKPFDIRKPFDNPYSDQLGEDMSFFDRCRQLDIEVFCNPSITVQHIMQKPLVLHEDYMLKQQLSNKKYQVIIKGLGDKRLK